MTKVIKYEVSDSTQFGFGKYLWDSGITLLDENQHILYRDVYKVDNWSDKEEQVGMKLVKVVTDEWLDKHDWMYYGIVIKNNTDKELRKEAKKRDKEFLEFIRGLK